MKLALFTVCVFACGTAEKSGVPSGSSGAASGSAHDEEGGAAVAPEGRKVLATGLPSSGMVCESSQIWGWSPDGDDALKTGMVRASATGELFDVLPGSGPDALRFIADNRVIELETEARGAFVAGSALEDILVEGPDAYSMRVAGRWQPIPGVRPEPLDTVARAHGAWWSASRAGLVRIASPTEVSKIALTGVPLAVVAVADELLVAHANGRQILISSIDAAGKATEVFSAPTSALIITGTFATNVSGWVAFGARLSGQEDGNVWVRRPGKKFTSLGKPASLVGLDGYDRIWFTRSQNVVARDAGGLEQAYPIASKKMFAEAFTGLRCYPIGRGFEVLPGAAAAVTGGIRLRVAGAGAWPFEACKRIGVGPTPCAGQPDRVSGTLDAQGQWSGPAPIGTYSFAVKRGDDWLQPTFDGKGEAFCTVSADRDCTIQFYVK